MAGPYENVFYLRVRLRVTVIGIALMGVILIPSIRIIIEYYGTSFMWVVWVPVLSLTAILAFLTVGIPLWMRDPVTFSYGENGIDVVLSSSLSKTPRKIVWENVIDVRRDSISPDMFEVVYSPTGIPPRKVVSKSGETFFFSSVEKNLAVTRHQLTEMRKYLPAQLRVKVDGYLGAT